MRVRNNPKQEDGGTGNTNASLKVAFILIIALKLHGRDWQLVEKHVGTRTGIQVRSHAQKYFMKENSRNPNKQNNSEYKEEALESKAKKVSSAVEEMSVKISIPNEVYFELMIERRK